MAELKLQHIYKNYNRKVTAIEDFNLDIKEKEFIVFVGPSGCGKSTILRMIAGLETISQGDLLLDGKRMNDVPSKERDIALVFQNYALYPHMNVYQNMAFGLKLRKYAKEEIDRRVKETAFLLGLESCLDRKPSALSGGQCQRVALGRAIVRDAKVFLMDEPLSNLDAKLRVQMRAEIIKLHERLQTTTIYVTHDQTEAMTMATRLVVMKEGTIQQIGSPKEVYDNPVNTFVGGFIGSPAMNFFAGTLSEHAFQLGTVSIPIPERKLACLRTQGYVNKPIILGVRPEDFYTEPHGDAMIQVKAEAVEWLGAEAVVHGKISSHSFAIRFNPRADFQSGQTLSLSIDMNKAHFFDSSTETRILLGE
ncbi:MULTISPECIES: sn-glycerol-3-phosphate ABC transporter ATP-binding protein UgpC [Bacillaceae]|uniref:ABC transporter ATP-binding protein n=1 Tax=Bacillaceae TaxID=186817 RepID=UPI000E71EF2A|nr:sn-glycerol-3-phosphate ABC transporter ATP-binding protein UgpC [Bacillus sp. PK3_68]RJS62548.1 sugar ABC transporter ATP-binding protein [Bacillus sp. PK3_68]